MLKALLRRFGYSNVITCLLIGWASLSCANAHNVKSEELTRSVNSLHGAIKYVMSGAVKKRSQNTRTYFSKYHAPGTDIHAGFKKKKERGQLIASIAGDRRPYRIIFLYKIERLDGSKYRFDRYDKSLAKKYLIKLNEHLASRPEDRDVIDDFWPY